MIDGNNDGGAGLAHSDRINLISFTPNGKYIVSGSEDTTVKVWDAESGGLRHTFYALEGGYPLSLSVSPDGTHIATGYGPGDWHYIEGSNLCPQAVIIREIQSGKTVKILKGHQYGVNSVAFSPDGRLLLSASHYCDKNPVILWDLKKGRKIIYKAFSSRRRFISFLPDGKHFVVAGKHNDIALVDIDSGETIRFWNDDGKHFILPEFGALSPDGKKLILGSSRYDEYMIWDTESGQETWIKTPRNILSLALSPDSHTVACGRESGVDFYHFDTGKKLKAFTLPQTNVTALAFSPDGRYIALGSDNNASALYSVHFDVLDFETGVVRHSLFTPVDYSGFAVCAPDGKYLYTRASRNIMKVWDTATGRELTRITGDWRDIYYAGLSPDGKYLAGILADSDLIKIWDTASGSVVRTISTDLPDGIKSLYFRCGGNKIVALANGGLHIFDTGTGLCISSIPGKFSFRQPAFNTSDDRYFGVLCRPEKSESEDQDLISIFDIETTSVIVTLPLPEHKGITAALYYTPGIILAAYYNWDHSQPEEKEYTITVYNAASGEICYTDSVSDLNEDAISFSPSGESLVMVMGRGRDLYTVSLKERGDAEITSIPVNHKGVITHVACFLDTVISASYDVINITDSKTGTLLRTIEAGTDLYLLPASADGRFLATASNCLVQIWDFEKKTRERELPVCRYPENAACIPDEKALVFVDDNNIGSAVYRYDMISGKTRYAFRVSKKLSSIGGFCFRPETEEMILYSWAYTEAAKVFNFSTGKEILTIRLENNITCAAYSHNGNFFVCGGGDCYTSFIKRDRGIFIFDAGTGTEIKRFPRSRNAVCTVAISHDDRYLLTGSTNHKIVLWDLEKTAVIRTYRGHKDVITTTAFTHDDKQIVSSAKDTTMRIWDRESTACLAVFPGIIKVIPESVFSPAWRCIAALTVHGTVKFFSKDTLEETKHLINFKDGTWVFS